MRSLLYLAAPLALLLPAVAHADVYTVTITVGSTQVADFNITSETPAGLGFIATAISGEDGGLPVTLLPNGAYFGNDSFFTTTSAFFDDGGFAFSTGSVADSNFQEFSIYSANGTTNLYCDQSETCHSGDGVDATVTLTPFVAPPPVGATPEPSSLVLLGTGILTAAGAARRRFRKA